MKIRDYLMVILLHGFLGYLFVLFVQSIDLTINLVGVRMLLFIAGIFLFGEIANRLGSREGGFFHPRRLAGTVTFVAVAVLSVNFIWWT